MALLVLGITSCLSHVVPSAPVDLDVRARDAVEAFWRAESAHDIEGMVAVSSYPFFLDANPDCLGSAPELRRALAKPYQNNPRVEVVAVREVTRQTRDLMDFWTRHLAIFLADDAPCLRASGEEATGLEAPVFRYYLVDFLVDGESVGALTRVRCRADQCAVSGVDN